MLVEEDEEFAMQVIQRELDIFESPRWYYDSVRYSYLIPESGYASIPNSPYLTVLSLAPTGHILC
ncbi:hypothetical protein EWM64_g1782 [Hericium alpestre]|uniref:Uncharacterized protein n=1 Tax=Hericium alpestre TaxID=135208 RepID=A0A4Z0A7B7_9AGAM|nr:hypothetical protein EWM64_g1782 [Hericium alpestre]